MLPLSWLILWLPFAVFLVIVLCLLKQPKAAGGLASGAMGLCFLMTAAALVLFLGGGGSKIAAAESSLLWLPLERLPVEFGVLTNGLTLLMALIVTGVGALIFLYSTVYMEHDAGTARFFAFLSLFAFSMLGIVFSNNLIQIFIFWELVGLSSYLLIGFWYEKKEASTAGKKAFLTTRVGDVGMMIGILLLTGWLGAHGETTFNFMALERVLAHSQIPGPLMTAIALLIFMGVMGKSAQVPLHVWLPDAMEGPTPVSALIHAATMVAAGVFLLARLGFIFSASVTALSVIAWTGIVTAFLAGTVAIVQNDIKKILAYSTLSQLGYMVLALGMNQTSAGMFHLTTHAFFKALLFLGAGSLIHSLHTQDIWEMSGRGLVKKMPVTSGTFLIGTLALMGVPPLSGFYSKEAVLESVLHGPAPLLWLALAVVFLTAFYMGRLCTVVFFRTQGSAKTSHGHAPHEAGWAMTLPLVVLAVLSVFGGWIPVGRLLGTVTHESAEALAGHWLLIASLSAAGAGFFAAFLIYRTRAAGLRLRFPGTLLDKKYFFDDFYDAVIRYFQENIARAADVFERKVIVETGANGTARSAQWTGRLLRRFQTGRVQHYALAFAAGVTLMVYILILVRK